MTIDEAITYHKKEADECKNLILKEKHLEPQESHYCLCLKENVEMHEQQAEWLEELKTRRETNFDYVQLMDRRYKDGYNKAVDDFTELLKLRYSFDSISRDDISKANYNGHIEMLAEHLKKGGAE